jgi:autotransporter-associated beta strand protein
MSRIKTKPLPQIFPEMFLFSVYGVCIICAIIGQFNGGIVAINSHGNLGTGLLSFDGGPLEALAAGGGIDSREAVTLDAGGGGTFLADSGTTLTLSGAISDVGSLTKKGAGTLILTGTDTHSGDTNVALGRLQADSSTALSQTGLSVDPGLKLPVPRGAEAVKSAVELRQAWKAELAHRRNFSRTGRPADGAVHPRPVSFPVHVYHRVRVFMARIANVQVIHHKA